MLLVHTCILWSPCCSFTPVFCGVLAARSHLYFVESMLLILAVFCVVSFFALFVFGQYCVPNELPNLPDHLSYPRFVVGFVLLDL